MSEGGSGESGKSRAPSDDVLFVASRASDGQGYHVLRQHNDGVELGKLCDLRQGEPIHGEVVRLTPREEHDRLFDVEVLVERPKATPKTSGPAQVATDGYRRNWERIFGSARPDVN